MRIVLLQWPVPRNLTILYILLYKSRTLRFCLKVGPPEVCRPLLTVSSVPAADRFLRAGRRTIA